mgnify:CR=1 FL=1
METDQVKWKATEMDTERDLTKCHHPRGRKSRSPAWSSASTKGVLRNDEGSVALCAGRVEGVDGVDLIDDRCSLGEGAAADKHGAAEPGGEQITDRALPEAVFVRRLAK